MGHHLASKPSPTATTPLAGAISRSVPGTGVPISVGIAGLQACVLSKAAWTKSGDIRRSRGG